MTDEKEYVVYRYRHTVLYAKGFYLMQDLLSDLRVVIAADGGMKPEFREFDKVIISEVKRMIGFLSPIVVEALRFAGKTPGHFQFEIDSHFKYIQERGEAITARGEHTILALESILSIISNWEISKVTIVNQENGSVKWLTLGDPDPEVLEVRNDGIGKQRWMR